MSTSKLKRLTIEHLRGSVTPFALPFEIGKKLTVIYGENGTGKTTICDAFEFLGKGKVGSLEDRGLGQTTRYWHSVGKKPADVAVVLETNTATCTARIRKGGVVAVPPASRPKVEVLRRSQILLLVEARPAERYEAIRRFIDVSGVEQSEASLRDLIRQLSGHRDTAVARISENEETIRQFWESAGTPGKGPIAWAEQEAARDLTADQAALQALENLRSAYQRLATYPERVRSALAGISTANTASVAAEADWSAQLEQTTTGAGELLDILEAAKPFLDQHPHPEACPLCESSERVTDLRERVGERAEQLSALQAAKRALTDAREIAKRAGQRLADLQTDYERDSTAFNEARVAREWGDDIPAPNDCPSDLTALEGWMESTSPIAERWNKIAGERQQQSQFSRTLKQALETYKANLQREADLARLLPRLKRALEIVAEERHKFTDALLHAIASNVGKLYEAVHPGEGLNKITLELDPKKRASLDIAADFPGQSGAPPQAYFSQSHLDTLGLCVFLALASLDAPAETILVLDDVLASVDEPHVVRLIEMLYAEALKFRHCIITTHYRPWKQKLRWGWLQNGQCHFIELTKWTTANGLQLIRSLPDIERLRQLLVETPPDPQLVCAKAGVVLEAALDFLTQLYECRVPRRADGLFTLGDLLTAIDKKLRQALMVEVATGHDASGTTVYKAVSLTPILEELTRIAQARNVFGCHFNTISFDLLESDAIGFGQQVLLLIDALTDLDAGWPRSSKSGSYWATSGETRRLHPLLRPT